MSITIKAPEKGSLDLLITLDVTPATLYWTLKDGAGTVINDHSQEEITNPTSSETVKLTGADLAIFTDEPEDVPRRYFHVSGTFLDGGNSRDISEEEVFVVDDFVCVDPVDRSS